MVKVKIDGKDYDTDALSQDAKAQLASLQFCDNELRELQAKAGAIQLARARYAEGLKLALSQPSTTTGEVSGAHNAMPLTSISDPNTSPATSEKKKNGFFGGLFGKK